jgi:hypothetical protein
MAGKSKMGRIKTRFSSSNLALDLRLWTLQNKLSRKLKEKSTRKTLLSTMQEILFMIQDPDSAFLQVSRKTALSKRDSIHQKLLQRFKKFALYVPSHQQIQRTKNYLSTHQTRPLSCSMRPRLQGAPRKHPDHRLHTHHTYAHRAYENPNIQLTAHLVR